jgi:hypothetical protein
VARVKQGNVMIPCFGHACSNFVPKARVVDTLLHHQTDQGVCGLYYAFWKSEGKPEEVLQPVHGLMPLCVDAKRMHLFIGNSINKYNSSNSDDADENKTITLSNVHACVAASLYHYDVGGEIDRGWGCTYRVLQTIVSNLVHQRITATTNKEPLQVPTLKAIQERLVSIGKESAGIVGSRKWLEPHHGTAYLASFGVPCYDTRYKCRGSSKRARRAEMKRLQSDLVAHFSKGGPTSAAPVMIDDSVFNYGICGVATDAHGNVRVLRFDPHVRRTHTLTLQHFVDGDGDGVEWLDFDSLFNRRNWMVLYPLADAKKPYSEAPSDAK